MAVLAFHDTAKTLGIIVLSMVTLPLSFTVTTLLFVVHLVIGYLSRHASEQQHPRKTILVTGVGMTKGLTLARAFYHQGHRVLGADFEDDLVPSSGRQSRSLSSFHSLRKPSSKSLSSSYTNQLVDLVTRERVDLWVSCSGVATAAEDGAAAEQVEKSTSCRCVQLTEKVTVRLHEKNSFIREAVRLGLPVPETHEVAAHQDVLRVLDRSEKGRQFIMKPVGMDDAHRGDMTLLPLVTAAETEKHVLGLPISSANPWIVQQFIPGGREYCTHALVVRGEVRVFTACPSSELLMHYKALPAHSQLFRDMLQFTRDFCARSDESKSMTGHMSFDFMVDEEGAIYAIECNPRVHTAVVLFTQPGEVTRDMVQAYLSVLLMDEKPQADGYQEGAKEVNGHGHVAEIVVPHSHITPRYWIGHDVVELGLLPIVKLVRGNAEEAKVKESMAELWLHIKSWKEGSFEAWDPLPILMLYHVYWPLAVATAWWQGRRWSRLNVSTTKMFMM
ncbi:hypothetical protein PpBr36_09130 [Pyricularia pennisetigena]|uniref:hypothetical protein n=1 Tax=Pyricularia pennisetigena TaxID=1578925 RepID=UPI00114D5EB3|nr:hypothetical protein PpBr36_09130 [Pyricularia pennisetigena]TLS24371.1 hypothetical protein PpBr36_09130 [Pyricularia pennisetigena]